MAATRERIVDAATELFHARGFRATRLADVLERADVRGGSLYYFFRTKEELLEAALARYEELLDPMIMEPAFATVDDPVERVFAVLDRYRQILVETDFELGCPIGNVAIELADAGNEVRERLRADFDLWARRIETCLDEAVARLPEGQDRRRLAGFVLTTMEGAVLVARGHRSIEPFDAAVAELRAYFGCLLGDAARELPGATTRSEEETF